MSTEGSALHSPKKTKITPYLVFMSYSLLIMTKDLVNMTKDVTIIKIGIMLRYAGHCLELLHGHGKELKL